MLTSTFSQNICLSSDCPTCRGIDGPAMDGFFILLALLFLIAAFRLIRKKK
jgi:hypothetical protein